MEDVSLFVEYDIPDVVYRRYRMSGFGGEPMKWKICGFIPLLVFMSLLANVENADKPEKGVWDFRLEKIWQVRKAGDDIFGRPFSLRISEDELVYVFDAGNDINYIFDRDGRFVRAFARAGQGPGEVQGQGMSFVIDDRVILDSMGSLHFFTSQGDYVKSMKKDNFLYDPHVFLSVDECITAPLTMIHIRDGKGEIQKLNIVTKDTRTIASFSLFEGGVAASGEQVVDVIVPGLSPAMTMGYGDGKLYWGMNDSYVINITGLQGEELGAFRVKRKREKISDSFKKKYVASDNIPPDMLEKIVESLPNEISCFHRIDVLNGLIYVYVPELELGHRWPSIKQIDIFSSEGKYLYKARLEFDDDLEPLFSPLHNLAIRGKNLYVVLTDKDDNVLVSKYGIKLPSDLR